MKNICKISPALHNNKYLMRVENYLSFIFKTK